MSSFGIHECTIKESNIIKISFFLLIATCVRSSPTALLTRPPQYNGGRQKSGLCPMPTSDSVDPFAIDRCWFDQDCSGLKKCCQTILGKSCVLPVNYPKETKELVKNGRCPTIPKLNGNSMQRCTKDLDCEDNKKCCTTRQGAICLSPEHSSAHQPAGQCPKGIRIPAGNGVDKCTYDSDCKFGKKCCNTANGKACLKPATASTYVERKPGKCPLSTTGTGTLIYRCLYDADCDGDKKCCDSKTGKSCLTPEFEHQQSLTRRNKLAIEDPGRETSIHCSTDNDCPDKERCCKTDLGKIQVLEEESYDNLKTETYSQKNAAMLEDSLNRCSNDGRCQQSTKCFQSAKGKHCTVHDNATTFNCPDGYKAVQPCLANFTCPEGYSCYKAYCCKSRQKKLYSDKTEKPGLCPVLQDEQSTMKIFQCYIDSHCPSEEKCCDTQFGKSCLTPLT
uniref:WAP domain-containing protein n=1 Tax=Trichuris muris TaxID=70415 RepID=A0A5S6QUB8_TRIMR